MNLKFVLCVALVVVLIGQLDAQRNNKRRRNRKKSDQCHLREVETCINKIQSLGKGKDPTSIIATSKGLDKLCSTIKDDTVKCAKTYGKKCGTPLHRELMDLILDMITARMSKFCKHDNPDRVEFLKESPCMHKKVLSTDEYKKTCNNDYLAAVDEIDEQVEGKADESHGRMCCAYNRWQSCSAKMIEKECGNNAIKQYENFMGGISGSLTNMACPKDLFPENSKECQKYKPAAGKKAKGKLGDNALTKYVTSLFSFMFVTDEATR